MELHSIHGQKHHIRQRSNNNLAKQESKVVLTKLLGSSLLDTVCFLAKQELPFILKKQRGCISFSDIRLKPCICSYQSLCERRTRRILRMRQQNKEEKSSKMEMGRMQR
ncbi:unnamed protein product [Acanthoscelides obtectus]|uniref:Uncharacterized protein n=1 Tax=Acanthoscelides obtectus TaxID=200917 RepID=A0A9P0KLB1_ACAOB|nr:unnamed protein product [Acanthoscelides obtectus]CAK1623696.1 hypothetical protein AOBTE_LOCUS2124 [Acanthoscelides obtectus]